MNSLLPWSQRLAQRYRFQPSETLSDWFDQEVWKQTGRGEFHQPVSPAELLDSAPRSVWPVLMGCDLLPLIGNGAGDYLCIRIDQANRDAEVVHWYHGGGDWIPWGKNLAEAIFFDTVVEHFPWPRRGHAVAPEDPRPNRTDDHGDDHRIDPWVDWASGWLPPSIVSLMKQSASDWTQYRHEIGADSIHQLDTLPITKPIIDHGICHAIIRLVLIEAALWSDQTEDWNQVERFANDVLDKRGDLAWAHHLAGLAARWRGDMPQATTCFLGASECSNFTDQSVRLQHLWDTKSAAKWSVEMLRQLDFFDSQRFAAVGKSEQQRLHLMASESTDRTAKISQYWFDRAIEAQHENDPVSAHRFAVRAGWDVGATTMDSYHQILPMIHRCADEAGYQAQAELAKTHLTCLRERYPIRRSQKN